MLSISTLLISCIVGQTAQPIATPEKWLDKNLDQRDRTSLEEMISYAPPEVADSATWILSGEEKKTSWKNLVGKVVIVQSWSNANANGRQAAYAARNTLSKLDKEDDVVLIAIHTPEGHKSANDYIEKKKLTFPTVVDPTGETCNLFGFYVKPTNFLIDRNGTVRHAGLQKKWLLKAVEELIAEEYNPEIKTETFVPPVRDVEIEVVPAASYPDHSTSFGSAKNQQGKTAPKFEIEGWVSGQTEVEDRTRIVEFWATWCGPCVRSIPHMNELHEHFGDSIAIVGVSGEKSSKVEKFMKKNKMKYGVAVDSKKRMQNAVSCRGIPLAMIISSDNIVRWQGHPSKLTEDLIQQVIDADGGAKPFKRGRWNITADHG